MSEPQRDKETDNPSPPPGHDKMLEALGRALSVPKSEIDRREAEWQAKQHKRGRPKKGKTSP
jgi:hypothetical protein